MNKTNNLLQTVNIRNVNMNLNIRNMVIWPVPSVRSDSEGTVRRNTSRKTSILRQTQAPISSKLQHPPGQTPGI